MSHPGTPLSYSPNPAGIDTHSYETDRGYFRGFEDDPITTAASTADLTALSTSDHWEDRIRAEVLRKAIKITLPDGFPCIYETPDSPNQARHLNPTPHAWVISPDIAMLEQLLPDYQELWDSYTAQWGPDSRRIFTVGRLDGLKPHRVYRPGTTPEQVIGATMLIHDGHYRTAPDRLRRMHPMHATWTKA